MDDQTVEQPARWNPTQLFALRFAAIYFLAFYFPKPFTLPLTVCKLTTASSWISKEVTSFWLLFDNFFGQHIFNTGPIQYKPSGSNDTLYNWMTLFSTFMLALIGSLVWTAIDRKRTHYEAAYEFLRIILRFSLAMMLLAYGFNKVAQFPTLNGHGLYVRFGDETPTGMLWNFMGASRGYAIFAGALEAGAGILLLFRRTTTLGALCTAAVMLNVFVLNVFYDVPLKIATFNYMVSGVVLALPDLGRLLNVLVLNRLAPPKKLLHPITSRKVRITALSVKWVLVGLLIYGNISLAINLYKGLDNPLVGGWDVTSFKQNGVEVDPNTPRSGRWKEISFSLGIPELDHMMFQLPSDQMFRLKYKSDGRTLTSEPVAGSGNFTFDQRGHNLTIHGTLPGGPVVVELVRDRQFELVNHPIHWIQEDWRGRDNKGRPMPIGFLHNGIMMVETSN